MGPRRAASAILTPPPPLCKPWRERGWGSLRPAEKSHGRCPADTWKDPGADPDVSTQMTPRHPKHKATKSCVIYALTFPLPGFPILTLWTIPPALSLDRPADPQPQTGDRTPLLLSHLNRPTFPPFPRSLPWFRPHHPCPTWTDSSWPPASCLPHEQHVDRAARATI